MIPGIGRRRLWSAAAGMAALGLSGCVLFQPWRRHKNELRLQATGEPAMARVVALRETDTMINHRPEVRIEVGIMHATRGVWNATLWRIMGVEDVQFLLLGRCFPVRFNSIELGVVAPARS